MISHSTKQKRRRKSHKAKECDAYLSTLVELKRRDFISTKSVCEAFEIKFCLAQTESRVYRHLQNQQKVVVHTIKLEN
jgi:hypothetical protein